jgi:hypothetical protein
MKFDAFTREKRRHRAKGNHHHHGGQWETLDQFPHAAATDRGLDAPFHPAVILTAPHRELVWPDGNGSALMSSTGQAPGSADRTAAATVSMYSTSAM